MIFWWLNLQTKRGREDKGCGVARPAMYKYDFFLNIQKENVAAKVVRYLLTEDFERFG